MKTVTYITIFAFMITLCGMGYGAQTYVDARGGTAGNTVNAGTGSTTDWWVSTAAQDNKWGRRTGFANNQSFTLGGDSDVFESSGTGSGRENSPMVKTTISGLYSGLYYNVWVVYWSADGQDWMLRAGFNTATMPLYDVMGTSPAVAGTATGKVEGNRREYTHLIGYTAADGSGKINIYIDDKPSDASQGGYYDRSWYDGLLYEVFNVPSNPTPADAAVSVATTTTTLSFTSMRDPNNLTQENPTIVSHEVYFDSEPNLVGNLIATLPKGSATQVTPPALEYDKKYYWRVDELMSDGSTITGVVWTFETVKTTPDFIPPIGSQPQNTSGFVNDAVSLTASAGAGSYTYQWYKGASGVVSSPVSNATGHISGAGTSQLTITVQAADEGYYWCRATNAQGSADSAAALIVVKRPVAHWTMDAIVGGQYQDSSSGGHNADVTGAPVPVVGKIGNAIPLDATGTGCANSGTWNPSQYSGQFSVSLWARWSGQTTTASWQGLVSKEVSFAADQMMWQLEIDQGNNNLALKNGSSVAVTTTPMAIGQWEHIVITFDGTTGRIYRNGSSVASGGFSLSSKTDAPMNIGASANNAGTYSFMFYGTMDDIQVYNYMLSPTEVAKLYTDVETGAVICLGNPAMDFSGPAGVKDCKVNLYDFAEIAKQWLQCNLVPSSSCN